MMPKRWSTTISTSAVRMLYQLAAVFLVRQSPVTLGRVLIHMHLALSFVVSLHMVFTLEK